MSYLTTHRSRRSPRRWLSAFAIGAAAAMIVATAPTAAHAAEVRGTDGNDVLNGTAQADRIQGFSGNDSLHGKGGNDNIFGGNGKDSLHGEAGTDSFHGGTGDDIIHARSNERDRISCGPGNDRAIVDRFDEIADATASDPNGSCEVVSSSKPYVLPILMSQVPGGPADYFDDHHDTTPAADIGAAEGTPIRAVRTGYVLAAGSNPAGQTWCGNGVLIQATDGAQYIYCHMKAGSVAVKAGLGITTGRSLGQVGCTGRCFGNHLHLQIFVPDMSPFVANSRCPAPLLKAIHENRTVPRPSTLPQHDCSA